MKTKPNPQPSNQPIPPAEAAAPHHSLPDPWLYDSEALLRDLTRCQELVNQISIHGGHKTHFDINTAANAIWTLTNQLRFLLQLHRDGQRAFRQQQTTVETPRQPVRHHDRAPKLAQRKRATPVA